MRDFDLNLYKIFCSIVETRSISKAAEKLFVSRQAVSYSIKQLENKLGGQLFFITSKGVVLTPEAEELYQHIKASLNSIAIGEKIFKENNELLHGTINIGCNPELFENCLYKHVDKFFKLYPNIKINIISKPISDLLKMDLSIYAIKVGRTSIANLNVNKELGMDISVVPRDNPDYDGDPSV